MFNNRGLQMKQPFLRRLYFLCIISVLNTCGRNIQDNKPADEAAKINLQLGVEYMRREKHDIALNKFQKALMLDNNYADAHNAIAVLYERLKLDNEAKQHYQKALTLKPKDSDTHNNYGQFLCRHKQWKEAEKHFLIALENPVYRSPEIPYTNAGLCLRSINSTKAEEYLRQALQKNPNFPRALYQMADLSYNQERYVQAQRYLQRSIEIAKHTAKTLLLGIRIEDALNNGSETARYASMLRKNFPDASETQLINQLEKQQ